MASLPLPKVVLFDMAGTTVDDNVNGRPLVIVCMQAALRKNVAPDVMTDEEKVFATINDHRGKEKRDALRSVYCKLTDSEDVPESLVDDVYASFLQELDRALVAVDKEIPGATETLKQLKNQGVKVYVGSGFPQHVVDAIVDRLGWKGLVDGAFSSDTLGKGRPDPIMIQAAMEHAGVVDKATVWKVGDTLVDIEEGKNAGVMTVAVETGTQTAAKLRSGNPDFLIESVAGLGRVLFPSHD